MLLACAFVLCSTTLRPPQYLLPLPLAEVTAVAAAAAAAVVLALHALLTAARAC